ncbi:hypothetical protein LCGC14_2179040 [marine sediment metagenome]|uniref:Uncharacterized protein n=1 Tax=marine sediment metagenome TaxID=412755 RepID=A0A0F9G0C9_9ZZZZ
MKKKQFFIVFSIMLLSLVFMAETCDSNDKNTAETKQAAQTEQILDEVNREIGLPNMVNFQQKKLMKMVYELSDRTDLVCYAYLQSEYSGKLVYIGRCIGFGVPFSAQYTNPFKVIDPDHIPGQDYSTSEGTPVVIPQADPNALYMPTSSSATWLLMVNPETNEPAPVFIEPLLTVSPFPLHNIK